MTKVEKKFDNPVVLGFLYDKQLLTSDEYSKPLPINPGCKFKGEHYGFVVKMSEGYDNFYSKEKRFKTQCKINAVTTLNGKICIFEENKYSPWELTSTGKVVKVAKFNAGRESEAQFLKENYGITSPEEIWQVNYDADQELNAPEKKIKRVEPENSRSRYFVR